MRGNGSIQQKFSEALDALIEQVKGDASVLAAILCGSLSYDTVWAKSDIDLVLVTKRLTHSSSRRDSLILARRFIAGLAARLFPSRSDG